MNSEFCVYTPNASDFSAAEKVALWTQGQHMLPKTLYEISGLFEQSRSVLVAKSDTPKEPIGHAAITATYSDNSVEIGTIIVSPDYRKQGVGHVATLAVLQLADELFPGWGKIAIANPLSAGLFAKLGAKPMRTLDVCSEVWEYCATCPKLPTQQSGEPFNCCDVPYNLSPVLGLVAQYQHAWLATYVWTGKEAHE